MTDLGGYNSWFQVSRKEIPNENMIYKVRTSPTSPQCLDLSLVTKLAVAPTCDSALMPGSIRAKLPSINRRPGKRKHRYKIITCAIRHIRLRQIISTRWTGYV